MVSIATWNINSVRLRMPQVARFLSEHGPDILCLQEIKTVAELFPAQAFADLGYRRGTNDLRETRLALGIKFER